MPKFGMVAALEREVAPLIRNWTVVERVHEGKAFKFFVKTDSVLVCGGIGSEAARRAAEAVISLFEVEVVQSVGYAGGLTPEWKVGTLIRPARIVDLSDGSSTEVSTGRGVLVTAATLVSAEQKRKLSATYQADAVDMEAAAVAKGTQAKGVRFAAMKVISDEIDFQVPPAEQFVTSDGQFQSRRFAVYAAVRPWLWRSIVALAKNSKIATRKLCEALEEEFEARSGKAAQSA